MSAKGNCTKLADGTIVYKAVSKTGSAPAELDSTKWYMDKCEIVGYRSEHLTIKINEDGIIRVDGNYNDGKASRSFFNEYIIPDGVNYEALEFRIYEADQNKLVIVGAIGSQGGEIEPIPAKQVVIQPQQQGATKRETTSTIKRTEDVRISSKITETFESTELEGSEDMSKEIRIVDNKFEAKVNVSEYRTEEIHVKISKKVVLIYTSSKEVTKTSTRKEIKKTFEIPNGVKPESITSVVGKDGNLTISAPVDDKLARQQKEVQETTNMSTTTISSTTTHQLQKQQKQVEHDTTSKELIQHQRQLQQIDTNEVVIRIRTVNTTKNVTGQDLKEVKTVKDRFEMNVDVRDFELEEVTVKINKTRRVITISANHKSQFESRSTYREFTLPAGTPDSNPNVIDAVLNSNGILTITGPCTPQVLPAALTDTTDNITKAVVKQQQENTSVQQQQQTTAVQQQQKNTSVQQQQQNTSVQQKQQNTSVQQMEDTSVEQHQSLQQIVQQSRYTKITRETFTSNTMTSLDVTEADDDIEKILISEPNTPIDDVTQDMVEDEDGNLIVELNVKNYRAEDITVKASKSTVTVILRRNDDVTVCKTIHVPLDVVITPDSIRSILEKSRGVLIIMIVRKKTTTTTKQITDNTTEAQNNEQKRVDSLQQQNQLVQQKQETVRQTQNKVQTQQQKMVQQKQESVEVEETETQIETHQQQVKQQQKIQQKQLSEEETQTQIDTQQQINQQRQVQQNRETVQETQTKNQTQQQINQQKQLQQKRQSIEETETQVETQQKINQQKQIQQKQESVQTNQQVKQQDQRQQNTTTTSTSKRTIKTTTTTVESLQKLGYNFESATKQVYTGDPKCFERATPIVDYKPEELEVKIAMPWVIIEGKQEMTAENGWRSKQFTKMFTVPEGVKQENIQLELNDAGDLVNCTALIG